MTGYSEEKIMAKPEYDTEYPKPILDLEDEIRVFLESKDQYDIHSLNKRIANRIAHTLLNFGIPEREVSMRIDDLKQSLNGDGTNLTFVIETVRRLYQQLIQLPPKSDDVTLVVQRTLRDDSDMRIAIRALRGSSEYQSLLDRKVWTIGSNELRQTLMETTCSGDSNWYKIIARIIRFRYPEGMVSAGIISAPALRNFLCDYVFCIPREGLIRKTISPQSYSRGLHTEGVEVEKLGKKQKIPTIAPPINRRDLLTPTQKQYSDLHYGWNGTSYDIQVAISVGDIAARLNKEYMAVFMGLRAAKAKLWESSDPNSFAVVESEVKKAEEIRPTEHIAPQPIKTKSNGGHGKNGDSGKIHIPAFLMNRRRIGVTPIPKRETPQPTYENIADTGMSSPATEPGRPKFQTVVVAKPKILPTPEEIPEAVEPISPTITFPEFLGYEASLGWLRNESSVQAGLEAAQNISPFKRDDLSIMALFRKEYPVLHIAFTRLRKLSLHSCLDIIHDIYHPDPLLILKKEPEVVKKVKACFAHHERGEYAEFTEALKEISHDPDTAGKIMEICEKYDANSFTEALSLMVDYSWTSEDDKIYETVSLRQVLQHTRGFSTLMEAVDRLPSDVSLRDLQKKLNSLSVIVIPGATSWTKYKSSQAISMTLLALLESLIKQESGYKKDDETSTKKLRRKLTDIAG